MLMSVIRALLFVAIIVAIIFGLERLISISDGVRFAAAGLEFTLGPVQLLVGLILLILAVWIIIKVLGFLVALLRFVAGDETALTRHMARSRERRGFTALAEAFTALAGGDGKEAVSKANRAEKLLRRPDLTNLIRAQAAEQTGDRAQATKAYKALLDDDRTRFVGVRGLMHQRLAEGDTQTAMKLAERAFVLKPRHSETSTALLQLQARHHNWDGARRTLNAKLKYGDIPKTVHKRRDAVLALADAQARMAEGRVDDAHDEAIEAARHAPTLVPAAVMASRAYIAMGKPRNAAKLVRDAWNNEPHPDLAGAYAEIEPNETPEERVERFQALLRARPGHPEARMLEAELEIAAENFPAARKALGNLTETHPNARTMTLMAAIERGEGADDSTVKAWLAKALTVSRGPQWICDNCGHVHGEWVALCDNCHAFDSLSWREAPMNEGMQGSAAAMLPLIIGALERPHGPTGASVDDDVIDQPPSGAAAEDAPAEQQPS